MKLLRIAAAAFVGVAVAAGSLPHAQAQDFNLSVPGFNFSFDTGDVAYAYRDGYWDHHHNWHRWHSEREAREFRTRYEDRYDDRQHDRVPGGGWREEHRDEDRGHDRDRDRDHDHREDDR